MSAPITTTDKTLLPFEERLKLVQGEVRGRVAAYPTPEQNYQRARLWSGWIRRNLLADTPAPAKPIRTQPFNLNLLEAVL